MAEETILQQPPSARKGEAEGPGEILARAEAMLAAGEGEGALALLEAAHRRFPDTGRGVPVIGRAYALAILEMVAARPWGHRWRQPLREALAGFVERNPDVIARDYRWLDHMLRPNGHFGLPVRSRIWRVVLAQPGIELAVIDGILRHAFHARDLETMLAGAERLVPLLEARQRPEDLPRWCTAADIFLIHERHHEAEACYRAASAIDGTAPRALIGRAALALDRGELAQAQALAAACTVRLAQDGQGEAAWIVSAATGLWASRAAAPPPESTAIVFFCHATGKLKRNTHLGPPGIGLIEGAVRSLRETMAPGPDIPMTVLYDHRDTPLNLEFQSNLARFCAEEGIGFVSNTGNGLRRQWLDAFRRIQADTVMVVEQDHDFVAPCPSFPEIIGTLARRVDINHLRINRRDNIRAGFDMMLSQTARDRASGILRTGRFSNTPHFIRRDFYDAVLLPIIADRNDQDARNFGAAGVEENVNGALRRLEPLLGLPGLMRLFGLAIWGQPGERLRTRHLGV